MVTDWAGTYFGEPWPSGICDEGRQVETPVGESCEWCEVSVQEGDQGSFIGVASPARSFVAPIHKECSLRQVVGSYACILLGDHAVGACHEKDEELGLSKREDALKVWEYVQRNGLPGRRVHG